MPGLRNGLGSLTGHVCRGLASAVRAVLYVSALVAAGHDAVIRAFYRRLVPAGKPKDVALVARMRKLLTIVNAMPRAAVPRSPVPAPAGRPRSRPPPGRTARG